MWRGRITWSVRRATAQRAAHRRDVSRVASLSLERDDGLLHRVNFARLLLVLLLDVQVLLLHLLMRRLSLLPQLPLVLEVRLDVLVRRLELLLEMVLALLQLRHPVHRVVATVPLLAHPVVRSAAVRRSSEVSARIVHRGVEGGAGGGAERAPEVDRAETRLHDSVRVGAVENALVRLAEKVRHLTETTDARDMPAAAGAGRRVKLWVVRVLLAECVATRGNDEWWLRAEGPFGQREEFTRRPPQRQRLRRKAARPSWKGGGRGERTWRGGTSSVSQHRLQDSSAGTDMGWQCPEVLLRVEAPLQRPKKKGCSLVLYERGIPGTLSCG